MTAAVIRPSGREDRWRPSTTWHSAVVSSARVPRQIRVLADYTDEALWDWEGFTGPINSWDLPLPEELRIALRDWARVQGQLAVTDFVWPDAKAHLEWQLQGLELALQVQQALGEEVDVDYSEAAPAKTLDDDPDSASDTGAQSGLYWSSSLLEASVESDTP